ncbi:hypothetical protein [Mycolicibacterium llatzerense]|uniref:hypothetical protein n=1 Tax=Mycolicibacterium llatzerense TaxID=280871 RepID=UPI0008DD5B75|nr:hypothetical protein [Mycolicibacterium llatzerense]
MNHEFDLAFILLDEAAERLHPGRAGARRLPAADHGRLPLTTICRYRRDGGLWLHLAAFDDHELLATVEATAPDAHTEPECRIITVRAGHLLFVGTGNWTFRADGEHRYTLTADTGTDTWTLTVDHLAPTTYPTVDTAIAALAGHEAYQVA